MKKTLKIFTILLALFVSFTFTGCFGGDSGPDTSYKYDVMGNGGGTIYNAIKITLNEDGVTRTISVIEGTREKISPTNPTGKVIEGYYDAEYQTKYINKDGSPLSAWGDSTPSTLYAKYDPLSSFSYEEKAVENEKEAGYTNGTKITFTVSNDMKHALSCHPDANVYIACDFEFRSTNAVLNSAMTITAYIVGDDTTKSLGKEERETNKEEFSSAAVYATCKASDISHGVIQLVFYSENYNYPNYFKNLELRVTFG